MRFNTLLDRDGKRIGAYQFAYDVTDRLRDQERLRTAEEALRQAQKMELAIVNLCVNARDAMPDGGVITIAVDNVREEEDAGGDFVKISVADTGVGMAPDVQARVFEPFFTTKDVCWWRTTRRCRRLPVSC